MATMMESKLVDLKVFLKAAAKVGWWELLSADSKGSSLELKLGR